MNELKFQRVSILIDAENIEVAGYKRYKKRTNYRYLIENLANDREIIRCIYYKPIHKEITHDFKSFLDQLGAELKQPMKNCDAYLIVDAITLADKMDVIAIVGGDKDYLPLLWYLKSRGCKTEVWCWPTATADLMKEASDRYVPLNKDYLIKDYLIKD
jgi:hypothetical protein